MLDQLVDIDIIKVLEVLLQICFSRLTSISDSHRNVFIEVSARACLEDVSSCLVDCANQQSNAERPL